MAREQTIPAKSEVLQWARRVSGLSVRDAARRLGLGPMELVAIEDGERAPSAKVFHKMVTTYKQVESVLLLPRPPKMDPLPQDFRSAGYGSLSLSPDTLLAVREARRIQHFITSLREIDREIIAHTEISPARLSDTTQDVAERERRRFGVTVAMQRQWGLYDDSFNRWRDRTQALGILVLLKRMPWRDCRGLSLWDEKLVPAIVVNTEDRANARIFTLFHEYAHIMLRQSGVCVQQDRGGGEKPRIEDWCNSFAAEFLVPSEDLRRSLEGPRLSHLRRSDWEIKHIRGLAAEFRVSRYVIARRLKELNISDFYDEHGEQLRLYDRQPPRETAGTKRPPGWQIRQKLAEIGSGAANVILDGIRSDIADPADAADLLGLRIEQLRDLEEKVAYTSGA